MGPIDCVQLRRTDKFGRKRLCGSALGGEAESFTPTSPAHHPTSGSRSIALCVTSERPGATAWRLTERGGLGTVVCEGLAYTLPFRWLADYSTSNLSSTAADRTKLDPHRLLMRAQFPSVRIAVCAIVLAFAIPATPATPLSPLTQCGRLSRLHV